MKFKIKHADTIVGVLSLIAFAALLVLIFFIGSKQKWFETKHPFYTVVTSASNVSEGMAIQYKGFGIGKVTSITLDENDRVLVWFYILDEHIGRVTKGSVLDLSVSPIGLGSQLIFHQGISGDIIADNSLIPEKASYEGRRSIVGGEVIFNEAIDSIASLMSSVGDLITNVNTVLKDVMGVLEGAPNIPLSRTVNSINRILQQINALLAGDKSIPASKIIEDLSTSVVELNNILANVQTLTANIKDPSGLVPKLLETEETKGSIDALLNSINASMKDVNSMSTALKNEMPQIPILLSQVQTLLKQAQDVMEGLKNNPLLKKGVPDRLEKESATPKLREENF